MNASRAPVAVVIVSWNAAQDLPVCLASLRGLERRPAEIVVVDNGSRDASVACVRSFPEVRLIEAGANLGFCRANNLGIAATRSPFVLVLNPDTRLHRRFLEELLPAFDDAPRVGIAAGKLLRFDGRTLDSAGQMLGRSRQPVDRGYGRPDRGQLDTDGPVFGACGAAALYRRDMLDAIADPGGEVFDERFFAFLEDLDLAWRAQRAGWRGAYRHRARGEHRRGATAGTPAVRRRLLALWSRSPEVRFHLAKNRYLTILRNDTWGGYLANLPFVLARDVATLAVLLVSSPSVLVRLWRVRGVFAGALQRRRLDIVRARHKTSSVG